MRFPSFHRGRSANERPGIVRVSPRALTIVSLSAPRNRIINPLRRETFPFVSRTTRLSRSLRRWCTREWHFAGDVTGAFEVVRAERVRKSGGRESKAKRGDDKGRIGTLNSRCIMHPVDTVGRFFARSARSPFVSKKLSRRGGPTFADVILSRCDSHSADEAVDDEGRVGDGGLFRYGNVNAGNA